MFGVRVAPLLYRLRLHLWITKLFLCKTETRPSEDLETHLSTFHWRLPVCCRWYWSCRNTWLRVRTFLALLKCIVGILFELDDPRFLYRMKLELLLWKIKLTLYLHLRPKLYLHNSLLLTLTPQLLYLLKILKLLLYTWILRSEVTLYM